MGLLDVILRAVGPRARSELAKRAARRAVKEVGEAIYDTADEARRTVEAEFDARRKAREAEAVAREARAQEARDAAALEDELAALKARLDD